MGRGEGTGEEIIEADLNNPNYNNTAMQNLTNTTNISIDTNADTAIKLAKKLIKQFEGLRLIAYRCPAGKKTIGYGHVLQKHELHLTKITKEQAELLLEQDIAIARAALVKYCTVPLTRNQEAALISFIFNCGVRAFARSTLLKKLNVGDYIGAADELLKWIHVKSIRVNGLVKRRKKEHNLFLAHSLY